MINEKNTLREVVVKLLLGIETITLFLEIKSFGNKNNILDDIKILDNKSNNLFAVMIDDENSKEIHFYTGNNSAGYPSGTDGVRPVISLKKNIKISEGTEEKEDPYTLSFT